MMNEIKLDELQPYFIASLCIPFTHIYSLDDAKTPFCGEAVQERHTPAYTATGVAEFGIAAGGWVHCFSRVSWYSTGMQRNL